MSQETKHPAAELLNTQMSAEENNTNKEHSGKTTITREKIEGTPFYIMGTEEDGYFLAMGKYKLTNNAPTKEEALEKLESEKWEIICRVITTTHLAIGEKLAEMNFEEKAQS